MAGAVIYRNRRSCTPTIENRGARAECAPNRSGDGYLSQGIPR